jgi:hypothetical protein
MEYNNTKSKTASLVKLIGIPGVCKSSSSQLRTEDLQSFLQIAKQNKIPLLFLRAIADKLEDYQFRSELLRYEEKHKKFLDLIVFIAYLLEKVGTHYTLFKTLKPFPYVPSDVDILLLSDGDLKTVAKSLEREGCIPLERNIYGITLFSPKHKMNIDITTQVAVSSLIYMNKASLFNYIKQSEMHGTCIQTLEPSVDLLAVAAHNLFKEQLYMLSDYYTLIMLSEHWKETLKIAGKFYLKHAIETALKMTRAVTFVAFGSSSPLMQKFEELDISNATELIDRKFELPRKYDLSTIVLAFLNKIKADPVSKNSLPLMALSASHPTFYKKIIEHATRKKY